MKWREKEQKISSETKLREPLKAKFSPLGDASASSPDDGFSLVEAV